MLISHRVREIRKIKLATMCLRINKILFQIVTITLYIGNIYKYIAYRLYLYIYIYINI